ncbi:ABC transporter ATP-binding protein [Novosphingobium sp. fls2-241-R2A-195]|uniref:ABC transporter ATP-binding protein n=1 Tax=Novosphingobium sp. fls2-241-R2A-195 TaxID=3040296 RepID=UPI00254BFB6E|nr:ABC transporter ATP-binding protein [Novosphingobium sp. fls2-241-R2A-195]
MILSRQARPETASIAPLAITRVSKSFGGSPVLDRVSLDIEPGERIALLGPSGSGKSTLLNLVAGFEQPDAGDILIDGRSVVALPVHRREIGMVFQHYALFPHLTVAENIAYPLVRRRAARGEIRERVDRLLASVRLEGFADRRIQTLSGGQQQRVAIARALAAEPAVLLMDEPMGALDRALREQLQVELKLLLQETRATVIYVTHDQREALALANRIAIMNQGRLEQVGAVEDIYAHPASAFAAQFLWAGANRLGAMVGEGGAVRLGEVTLDARWPSPPPRPGMAVDLVVRPEDVALHEPRDGALGGTVLTALFAGTHRTVQIRLCSGAQLHAVQPITAAMPVPGTAVGVTIAPGAACAYPASAR